MQWIFDNWLLVLLIGGFVAMHLFHGHGHGRGNGNGHGSHDAGPDGGSDKDQHKDTARAATDQDAADPNADTPRRKRR